jgi:signal transduction histidine kinase/CheY-like chemotaxis protein
VLLHNVMPPWCRRAAALVGVLAVSMSSPLSAQLAPASGARTMWQVIPDGTRIQVFAERRFDGASGLRASTVFAMEVDRNGIPWTGADDGLYSYASGQWRREAMPPGFENQQVRSLLMQGDGGKWIGTRRGLVHRARGGNWRVFGEADGLAGSVVFSLTESFAIDGSPRVVAGTSRGVAYFDGSRFVPMSLPTAMAPLGVMVAGSADADRTPELWAASASGGLAVFRKGQWSLYSAAQGLALPDVQFVLPVNGERGGRVYAAGSGGVFVLDRSAGRDRFVPTAGSPMDVYRLATVNAGGDRDELWAGTRDGTVHRLRDGKWTLLRTSISDRHAPITLLKSVPGHGGGSAVYASARGSYLVRLSYGVAGALEMKDSSSAVTVSALFAERGANGRDALWVGTQDQELLHIAADGRRSRFVVGTADRRRVPTAIRRVSFAAPGVAVADGDGEIVVLADSSPWRQRGSAFSRVDNGLEDVRTFQVERVTLPDGTNALLAATSRGVRRWSGTQWEPAWPQLTDTVTAIASGREGGRPVVYLGGRHQVRVVGASGTRVEVFTGLGMTGVGIGAVRSLCRVPSAGTSLVFALDDDHGIVWRAESATEWKALPASLTRVLSTLGVPDMACLGDGRLVAATFSGLAVFDVTAPSPDKWVMRTRVSDADGLPASGVVAVAPGGAPNVVWVGTSYGIGIADVARAALLPPARLTMRVVSESRGRNIADGDVLGPDENDVHIDPMLLTFHREELTRYRVRLSGTAEWPSLAAEVINDPVDGEWIDSPSRYYHDLAPGEYVLSVWAYDWAGREYGPVQRSFSVLTPNWKTWPARVIYILWVVLLLMIAYRWRVRTLRESDAQLLASERRARDSEGRFRAIFEQALDGHLLLEDGRVQASNAVAASLFGATGPDELQGRTVSDLFGDEASANGLRVSGEWAIATSDTPVPVHYTITEVPSADRVLQHVVIRDLTEVRKAEAERAWFQAQVREAQKLESLGTLAGGVAHDFNNLLGVIRGNAELARTALRRGRSNDDNLGAILDASDRARDIVRQILTFSRRSSPTREYVNLSRLVLDLLPLLRRMVPRTVQLTIEGTDDAHLLMGDPTQLQQLLLNLVSNAAYAMRSTTNGLLTLELSSRVIPDDQPAPRGAVVVLRVRDTGAGMSDDVRSRIFEPFFTTKPTGEGTGLGMAVVHGIVVSHEGRAEVYSEEGKGSVFEIRFPQAVIEGLWDEGLDPSAVEATEVEATEVEATEVEATEVEATADGPEPMGVVTSASGDEGMTDVLEDSPYAGTTIVVVDDEPAVASVVERALQHYGHVVRVFNAPEAALQFIRQQPSSVDLLITDQTMPGMTGDLLAEAVHALRSELPVLILTGFSHRLTPERIAASGVHAVMLKPVELPELKRRVDEALSMLRR